MGIKESIEDRLLIAINIGKLPDVQTILEVFIAFHAQECPTIVNSKLIQGATNPVARASFSGNLDIVKLLVDKGANIEIPTENGNTAIMWAAFVGNARIVDYLITCGAGLNHFNRDGNMLKVS